MNAGKSYIPPVRIGDVIRPLRVAHVIHSNNPVLAVCDYVNPSFHVNEDVLGEPTGRHNGHPTHASSPVYRPQLATACPPPSFTLRHRGQPLGGKGQGRIQHERTDGGAGGAVGLRHRPSFRGKRTDST
ncbi:hypothetical protein B1218_37755, partial [Pseudomonas ogarae]